MRGLQFISGSKFWSSPDGANFLGPFSLQDIGLPEPIKKIDAAFVWGKNNNAYVFRGNWYWKLGDDFRALDGYPKNISNWRGLSSTANLDAIFTSPFDGTY